MTEHPRFAHASEAELARILDYYGVEWEYEPRTFPILWNADGKVVESFSPDFFLPELDVYVELTTLKQSLVRRKNRKLRRLRELYPDIKIKLFYGKDFRALMLKYGRFDLAASLSGLEGQLSADRVEPEPSLRLAVASPQVEPQAPAPVAEAEPKAEPAIVPQTAAIGEPVRRLYRPRPSRGTRRRRGRRAFIGLEREA